MKGSAMNANESVKVSQGLRKAHEKVLPKSFYYSHRICPRCLGGPIRFRVSSRHDNQTAICSNCSMEEKYINHANALGYKITADAIMREKRIPLCKSSSWFSCPKKDRPLWLEAELLQYSKQKALPSGRGTPQQNPKRGRAVAPAI
jgi:hypothetical protein